MNRADLLASWAKTTRHLRSARELLPESLVEYPSSDRGSVAGFEDFLKHNELELALDELEGLGDANACSAAFWRELSAAAENMQLFDRVERYRRLLEPPSDTQRLT